MVHTVRRTLRGVEQERAETARNALRAGPAHLRRESSLRTGAAAQAAPGSPGSRTTRIPRSVPEPGPDSTR
ncbi:hypothetical protein C6W96_20995 [Streptomyces sp. CS149]|uniref:Uncharacterized protein n=1 Tax=Streptomyces parvus TaxID=66428 RepID=A0A5D4IP16_9ACTN|nr:hypothetical protein C6W96_20995 [Streptomyces sp. CS149]PVC82856.1 hypothetical protein DBP20_20960 [Streptomyces sp. CS131]PVC99011.1 hypothetical protein DBP12_13570 [Streptomyces sp. CS014]PVC99803.1 hypothetical protein DBP21_21285 [Streptomyces sp. CS147]TYR54918.1 hypothetical protein FY004_25240 [Streptomyces parvus]